MKTMSKKLRGSVLVITVMFTMVIALVTGSFLHLAMSESRLSNSVMYANNALNLSEAGVELALNALNHHDWSQWTNEANDLIVMAPLEKDLGAGTAARIRAHIVGDNLTPTVLVEGVMSLANRPDVSRQIEVRLERRRYFANGITSLNQVYFTGGNSRVDSYQSSLGDYDETTNRFDNGSVASTSILANTIDLSNGEVFGFAAAGGQNGLRLGPQGKVYGEGDNGHSPERVAYDYYGEFPPVTPPSHPWTYAGSLQTGMLFGDPNASEPSYYLLDSINVSGGNHKFEIVNDAVIYVTGDISISGNAHFDVAEGVNVTIYVDGNVSVSGSGAARADRPENFLLIGTNDTHQTFELGGNAAWTAAVYAPNANVHLNGGGGGAGKWHGGVVGKNVRLTGNYRFHYDEDLKDFIPDDATFRMARWRELRDTGERYDFAINTDEESRKKWWEPM